MFSARRAVSVQSPSPTDGFLNCPWFPDQLFHIGFLTAMEQVTRLSATVLFAFIALGPVLWIFYHSTRVPGHGLVECMSVIGKEAWRIVSSVKANGAID